MSVKVCTQEGEPHEKKCCKTGSSRIHLLHTNPNPTQLNPLWVLHFRSFLAIPFTFDYSKGICELLEELELIRHILYCTSNIIYLL